MKLWTKLKNLATRRARVRRLEEEMAHHIELLTEENVARGLDRVEARRQAHLAFGNVLATREESEDTLGWPRLESWVHDLRVAARSLLRRPAFALSLAAVLTLGIGATASVYSLVRGVLFEPLPVPQPEELHLVREPSGEPFLLSAPAVRRLNDDPAIAGRAAAYSSTARAAFRLGAAPTEQCSVQFVSANFFAALRVTPQHGRAFTAADDPLGAPQPVAIVSHAFWRSKLGGDPAALGRSLRLNGQDVTVVGVAPATFSGVSLGEQVDLWLPLGLHAPLRCSPSAWTISDRPIELEEWMQIDNATWLSVLVRVPPGERAWQGRVEAAWRPQLDAALSIITEPNFQQQFRARVPQLVPSPQGFSDTRDGFRRVGLTLTLLVGAVVLVTAANSATLLLLRVLARGRELGVRLALGAGQWRLARAALMEGVLLAFVGATGGVILSLWLTPLLATWLVPAASNALPSVDGRTLAVLATLAIGLGLVMGAAPAWFSARLSPQAVIQQRYFGGGTMRVGRMLIVAQLAMSVLLISVAGALALDLRRVLAEHPGFERASVVQAFFDLRAAGIPVEQQAAVLERIRTAARELPQVRAVGFAASGALSGSRSRSGTFFRGEGVNQPRDNVQHESVDAGYFEAMGMTLLRGRGITRDDESAERPPVAVISERLAREALGGADAIGRRFGFDQNAGPADREVVGVVADARINGVRDEAPAVLYTVLAQWQSRPSCLVVRVAGDGVAARLALQKRIAAAEPGLLFTRWATLEERTERWMRNDVATVRLTAGFGALATLLAVIGVFGALGYLVASRSREIAVRLAIGAEPGRVWREVLRDAARLGLLGAGLGALIAVVLPHVLGSWMMTGLRTDWGAVALAAGVGLLAAVVGGLLPARRATKVDPLSLLRAE